MNKVITFGEIMMRLATPEHKRFGQANSFNASFGGGEANVAVSLAKFGIPTEFVSCIPDNDIGSACLQELHKQGVGTRHILRDGDRLGIYFLETGAVNRAGKVIYDRSYAAFSQLKKGVIDWDEVFNDAEWFHWSGITPALSQSAAEVCREAIHEAGKKGITVSCDLNYRDKLWNYGKTASEVMPELLADCDIVMGNEEDAEKILNITADGTDVTSGDVKAEAYASVSEQIIKRFPKVKKVITTLRASISASHNTWSGVLYDGKTLFKAPEYNITHIVDRIGGGDAFMAGLIYGMLSWHDDQKALDFATAASCLKHTIHGDFNLVTVDEVNKLMQGDHSGRVSR
ncbi:MAG: sugar kinase [Bacteroidota bacterium]